MKRTILVILNCFLLLEIGRENLNQVNLYDLAWSAHNDFFLCVERHNGCSIDCEKEANKVFLIFKQIDLKEHK